MSRKAGERACKPMSQSVLAVEPTVQQAAKIISVAHRLRTCENGFFPPSGHVTVCDSVWVPPGRFMGGTG